MDEPLSAPEPESPVPRWQRRVGAAAGVLDVAALRRQAQSTAGWAAGLMARHLEPVARYTGWSDAGQPGAALPLARMPRWVAVDEAAPVGAAAGTPSFAGPGIDARSAGAPALPWSASNTALVVARRAQQRLEVGHGRSGAAVALQRRMEHPGVLAPVTTSVRREPDPAALPVVAPLQAAAVSGPADAYAVPTAGPYAQAATAPLALQASPAPAGESLAARSSAPSLMGAPRDVAQAQAASPRAAVAAPVERVGVAPPAPPAATQPLQAQAADRPASGLRVARPMSMPRAGQGAGPLAMAAAGAGHGRSVIPVVAAIPASPAVSARANAGPPQPVRPEKTPAIVQRRAESASAMTASVSDGELPLAVPVRSRDAAVAAPAPVLRLAAGAAQGPTRPGAAQDALPAAMMPAGVPVGPAWTPGPSAATSGGIPIARVAESAAPVEHLPAALVWQRVPQASTPVPGAKLQRVADGGAQAAAASAMPVQTALGPAAADGPPDAASRAEARPDLHRLAEQVTRLIVRRLDLERERRGGR